MTKKPMTRAMRAALRSEDNLYMWRVGEAWDREHAATAEAELSEIMRQHREERAKREAQPSMGVTVFEDEAARLMGLTKRGLEQRRNRGAGPQWCRAGKRTAYWTADLRAWLATKPKGVRPLPDDEWPF